MSLKNTSSSYGSVSKFFHWTIFFLLAGMLSFGYFMEDVPKEYQGIVYNTHKLTGLTILVLMVLRLIWSAINPKPALPIDTPLWQRVAEWVVHGLIYVAVILMPLVGWVGAVAGGHPPHMGEMKLWLPIDKNDSLSDAAFNVHNTTAIVIIVLISIHILAALYHYFIKNDGVLGRMMPHIRHR